MVNIVYATNGTQSTGFGAISNSLGGATVASGWDTISAMSNPASFGLLESNRMDMSFEYFTPPRSLNDVDSDSNTYLLPFGGIANRTQDGRITYGLAWGFVSGLGADFRSSALPSSFFETSGIGNVYSQYLFIKVIPTVAYKPTDKLSLGFGLTVNYQGLELSHPFDMNGNGLLDTQFTLNNAWSLGIGANIGAIYKVSDMIRLGVSYTTKQSMEDLEWNTGLGKVSMKLDGVEQAAFGIAISPMKNLTIELNERWLRWSDVLDNVDVKLGGATIATWKFGWDDQWVTSLGVTYMPSTSLTLRGGWNYGKSPIQNEDVDWNLATPAIVENHAMLGLGYRLTKNIDVNLGYGHAFKKEFESPVTGNKIKLSEDWLDLALSVRF